MGLGPFHLDNGSLFYFPYITNKKEKLHSLAKVVAMKIEVKRGIIKNHSITMLPKVPNGKGI